MRYPKAYAGALELQELLLRDARDPSTKAAVRGSLARSYAELEEMKRKIAMRPLPKSIDTTKLPRNQRKQAKANAPAFSEGPPPAEPSQGIS